MASANENGETRDRERKKDTGRRVRREEESVLVDVKEAARLCGISRSMLYKLNSAGRMPKSIRLGTLVRWKRKDIMAWMENGCPTGAVKKRCK